VVVAVVVLVVLAVTAPLHRVVTEAQGHQLQLQAHQQLTLVVAVVAHTHRLAVLGLLELVALVVGVTRGQLHKRV